ncbi:MAG: sensor histidine kinase [Anaerolineales bacterium]|nr:sensor histidine kinase [Anaerolineales bacterium]
MKKTRSTPWAILERHPELWFFIFATLVFVAMYIWSLFVTPHLQEPAWFVAFTGLTIVHVALHWSLVVLPWIHAHAWMYILVQGGLAFLITLLSGNIGMIFCLYLALIGEAIGLIRRRLWLVTTILFYLALSLINYLLMAGSDASFWWLIGILPMLIFVILYVSLYTRESAAREQAQGLLAELEKSNQRLSVYATEVERLTLEAERQRMARELHDTLAQGLAGLILQLEAVDSHLSNQNLEKGHAIIQQAMSRARTTLAEARSAIRDLRSEQFTSVDLSVLLRSEVEHFRRVTGIPCELEFCAPEQLPAAIQETVLRLVREALLNSARHAQASQVTVRLACAKEHLQVVVGDNGIGFDPHADLGQVGHYGLIGLRERARLSGGDFAIESAPGRGTTLMLSYPRSSFDE